MLSRLILFLVDALVIPSIVPITTIDAKSKKMFPEFAAEAAVNL